MAGVAAESIIEQARRARVRSRRLVVQARRRKEAWTAWQQAWRNAAHARGSHGRLILVICAYCRRLRRADDSWTPLPSAIEVRLSGLCGKYVSHGLCPACFADKFGSYDPGASTSSAS